MTSDGVIAIFLPNLSWGGAERVALNLARALRRSGCEVELLFARARGPLEKFLPEGIPVIDFGRNSVRGALPGLVSYLRKRRPKALISHLYHANLIAALACRVARTNTKAILVEHIVLSGSPHRSVRSRVIWLLLRWIYRGPERVVGVCDAVARDLEHRLKLKPSTIRTIYNPVVDDMLIERSNHAPAHPWLENKTSPILLAAGRFTAQKDFGTLVRAFALVRQSSDARLIILGDGEARMDLESLVGELGLADFVSMPGYTSNPYAYMSRADVFISSSVREGLPTVLVEAMACGCPVIATDCDGGVREIINDCKYGKLVPPQDARGMSEEILHALINPARSDFLKQAAHRFACDRVANCYIELIENCT